MSLWTPADSLHQSLTPMLASMMQIGKRDIVRVSALKFSACSSS